MVASARQDSKSVLCRSKSIVKIKKVTSRSDRLDNVALSASRQRLSQMDDVRIDISRVDDGVTLPHRLDKLFTRNDLSGMPEQMTQHLELGRRRVHAPGPTTNSAGPKTRGDVCEVQFPTPSICRHMRPNLRQKRRRRQRLLNNLDRPRWSYEAAPAFAVSGQNEERSNRVCDKRIDSLLRRLFLVEHVCVEDDEAGLVLLGKNRTAGNVAGRNRPMSLVLKNVGNKRRDILARDDDNRSWRDLRSRSALRQANVSPDLAISLCSGVHTAHLSFEDLEDRGLQHDMQTTAASRHPLIWIQV